MRCEGRWVGFGIAFRRNISAGKMFGFVHIYLSYPRALCTSYQAMALLWPLLTGPSSCFSLALRNPAVYIWDRTPILAQFISYLMALLLSPQLENSRSVDWRGRRRLFWSVPFGVPFLYTSSIRRSCSCLKGRVSRSILCSIGCLVRFHISNPTMVLSFI
jgi:hypothetical protein